jgi:hypothetical protein
MMSKRELDLIEAEMWDHYSGLPNPAWYEYEAQLRNEEIDEVELTININYEKRIR